ncbi:phosphotransferase [Paenibacillus thermotolerans]|uniref:phosphotransferase n=1 Tax=Paenibacillus thermotolerans TaxID=3027807 RepID=UPI0023684CAC|nr:MULTISPECIES: phosphotransferase [unclassified Paenibacillus]
MKEQLEHCAARLRMLGMDGFAISVLRGPFAADVLTVAPDGGAGPARLIYKQPAEGRRNEIPLLKRLGDFLKPWGPVTVAMFEDEPQAMLTEYAGEPVMESYLASQPEGRRLWLRRIVCRLAALHAASSPHVSRWVSEGFVEPYPFSMEWPALTSERLLALEKSGVPYDIGGLRRDVLFMSESFYPLYKKSLRCPPALTHGDPHMRNIVGDENRFVFIDWEWANAATPPRDIAILLQDVRDDALAEDALLVYTDELLAQGYPAGRADVLHDFELALIDNTIMMLAWDAELYFKGETTAEELCVTLGMKRRRLQTAWARASGRLNR